MHEQFTQEYLKQRSKKYYQKFWAESILESGLSIKTPDGKEIMVKPSDLWCNDLGSMIGNCLCGHAIRYEFWFGTVGPIGSTCIQTITGLEGQDLRKVLRGGQLAKQDKKELEDKIESFQTLENQLKQDNFLKEKIEFLKEQQEIPEEATSFLKEDIPLPNVITHSIERKYNKLKKVEKITEEYDAEIAEGALIFEELARELEGIISDKVKSKKTIHNTIRDLGYKLLSLSPFEGLNQKQTSLFRKLIRRAKNQQFADALFVLINLKDVDLGDWWNKVVSDILDSAIQYGLTEKQIAFILDKSSTGKPGIAKRFAEKIVFEKMDDNGKIQKSPQKELKESSEVTEQEETELDLTLDLPE